MLCADRGLQLASELVQTLLLSLPVVSLISGAISTAKDARRSDERINFCPIKIRAGRGKRFSVLTINSRKNCRIFPRFVDPGLLCRRHYFYSDRKFWIVAFAVIQRLDLSKWHLSRPCSSR
jgi:hypothetical protein